MDDINAATSQFPDVPPSLKNSETVFPDFPISEGKKVVADGSNVPDTNSRPRLSRETGSINLKRKTIDDIQNFWKGILLKNNEKVPEDLNKIANEPAMLKYFKDLDTPPNGDLYTFSEDQLDKIISNIKAKHPDFLADPIVPSNVGPSTNSVPNRPNAAQISPPTREELIGRAEKLLKELGVDDDVAELSEIELQEIIFNFTPVN